MRKKIVTREQQTALPAEQVWLDLEQLARVELTSEHDAYPIESAFKGVEGGWRAAQPGEQTVRIVFDEPQNIRRIQLHFDEKEQERTQEFLLRWISSGDKEPKEIIRQHYNFSPPHTVEEREEYTVNLQAVSVLELYIVPDISGKSICASVAQIKLAS
ncbi:hypothetical protein [Pontibacter sp. SGAir0037]|uniref:hypothetical protein n=1 Tax=Pontibacter sp. SGAir0037 TaxID=2571030 RepID=UPI0010CD1170|nr:hypothetical protein [Pontibacter sp. SGAir0037]QCR22451.1 hypothetical protein C1N53_08965 [Pontibacter sp. SGAir0037]